MMGEIRRIGLLSAGTVCALMAATGTVFLGLCLLVAVALSGEAALFREIGGMDPDAPADVWTGVVVALAGTIWLTLAAALALAAGFVLGVLAAAAYNVWAGIAGGLRIAVVDPRPRDP